MTKLHCITDIIDDIRAGKMVIIVDDENRENEGDLVMAAKHINAAAVNFMATHGRGLICLSLTESHCQQLGLTMMVHDNCAQYQTAFTTSIEAAVGVTTGISAHDRARTILVASSAHASPSDIVQPGHIFPLKARHGGVLARAGHTEASVDLANLAGLHPSAVICEILNDDGSMARLPELQIFAEKHNLKIGSIAALIEHRITTESLVERVGGYPVCVGKHELQLHLFREQNPNDKSANEALIHMALTYGGQGANACFTPEQTEVLVRVQFPFSVMDFISSDSIKEVRGSSYPWQECLNAIVKNGTGVAIGLRAPLDEQQELQKLANALTASDATIAPPAAFRWDSRIYGTGAQMLRLLGISKMRLLSSPVSLASLQGFGLEIIGFEKLV